jgi:hypothetical protein
MLLSVDVTMRPNELNVNLKMGKKFNTVDVCQYGMYSNTECSRIILRLWGGACHPTIVTYTATVDTGTNLISKMDNSDTDVCGHFNIYTIAIVANSCSLFRSFIRL